MSVSSRVPARLNKVVINSKKVDDAVVKIGCLAKAALEKHGVKVTASGSLAKKVGCARSGLSGDVVIAIGGDGTILGTVREMKDEVKILGIHRGTVGFLTEVGEGDALGAIERLLRGNYRVEERSRISAKIDGKSLPLALNEIAIITATQARIIKLEVRINGKTFGPFSADGIILATPTGSTAYSLSAGGPILDPSAKVFVLVPICPYNFATHSLVVPDDSKMEIFVLEGAAVVTVDGQVRRRLKVGQALNAENAHRPAKFIRMNEHFYKKLNEMVR